MNETTEIIERDETAPDKIKRCVTDCCVGGEYDFTVKLFSDRAAKTPECSHHMRGSYKHSLCKILCVGGIIAVGLAALICVTHVVCGWVCSRK